PRLVLLSRASSSLMSGVDPGDFSDEDEAHDLHDDHHAEHDQAVTCGVQLAHGFRFDEAENHREEDRQHRHEGALGLALRGEAVDLAFHDLLAAQHRSQGIDGLHQVAADLATDAYGRAGHDERGQGQALFQLDQRVFQGYTQADVLDQQAEFLAELGGRLLHHVLQRHVQAGAGLQAAGKQHEGVGQLLLELAQALLAQLAEYQLRHEQHHDRPGDRDQGYVEQYVKEQRHQHQQHGIEHEQLLATGEDEHVGHVQFSAAAEL